MEASRAPSVRAWIIWTVGVAAYVLSIANRSSLSAVGVEAADRFSADASTLSMFAVLQLGVYALMQVPVGILLDRHGARPIMTIGLVLMCVGQLVMAFSPNVGVAIAARMLLGAGDAALFPSVLRLVSTWYSAQRAPLMAQLTGTVGQCGQLISLIPLPILLHATSWEVAFATLAGTAGVFAIVVFLIVRNHPPTVTADVSVNTDTGAIRIVKSSFDLRQSLGEAWQNPGTRLGFWSHFTTPFAGTAFIMLWGVPFLTAGEGQSREVASVITTLFVLFGMALGPVLGTLSGRHPLHRSYGLVLPTIGLQFVVWMTVILWPVQAPMWLLVVLVFALATGGPASMIAFDHARAHNPQHRLSTATGLVNAGGFISALIVIFAIGLLLDLQGAGSPENYTLDAFRIAFLAQVPLWLLGSIFIVRGRTAVHRKIGLKPPKKPKNSDA